MQEKIKYLWANNKGAFLLVLLTLAIGISLLLILIKVLRLL